MAAGDFFSGSSVPMIFSPYPVLVRGTAQSAFRLCLLAFAVLVLLGGCAKRPVPVSGDDARAAALWNRFQERDADGAGFAATASLNLSTPKARRRVRLRMWGNTNGAVRLDLVAGVGVTAGMWREGPEGFVAYMPQARAAYRYADGREGMGAFGLPATFTLRQLALALCGRFSPLFPLQYDSARLVPDTGFAYSFAQGQTSGADPAELVLDQQGRPVLYVTGGEHPWRLAVSGWAEAPGNSGVSGVPERVVLEWNGGKATLFVKEAGFRPGPWDEGSLVLSLPPGTSIRKPR